MELPADPRAELKKKSEVYARYILHGVPRAHCRPFELPAPGAAEKFVAQWRDQSFWEMWSQSRLHQFYLLQWVLQHGSKDLQTACTFVVRIGMLPNKALLSAKEVICKAVSFGSSPTTDLADNIHKATRKLPYEASAFVVAMRPLLIALPEANVTCNAFLESPGWALELCCADFVTSQRKSATNFDHAIKPLLVGVGGYGLVQLAFEDQWGLPFALKRQIMYHIVKKKNEDKVFREMRMAMQIDSPFIVNAYYAYVDRKDLVLALRMMPGGALSYYVKLSKKRARERENADKNLLSLTSCFAGLGRRAVQFYIASTVLALEALHEAGFVYRDLKDKNVLLDADGRARLCDFGLSHDLSTGPARGRSGTKGFWAPEQLAGRREEYTTTTDLWTLGVCAYHWATGEKPFPGDDSDLVAELIRAGKYDTSSLPHFDSSRSRGEWFVPYLKELCAGLLTVDPSKRLGCGETGLQELKLHPFFNGLDWTQLFAGQIKPPILPNQKEITADLPSTIKEDFFEWTRKASPEDAQRRFNDWDGRPVRSVFELMVIEWLDKNPLHFSGQGDEKQPSLLQPYLWSTTVLPPAVADTSEGPATKGKNESKSNGCCLIA